MRGEIVEFFIIKQIKKPRLVLCSVVKHLGSGRALKKWGKTLDCVSCFPLHFFRALPLPACFTTEHSTVEATLFVKYTEISQFKIKTSTRLPGSHPYFTGQAITYLGQTRRENKKKPHATAHKKTHTSTQTH